MSIGSLYGNVDLPQRHKGTARFCVTPKLVTFSPPRPLTHSPPSVRGRASQTMGAFSGWKTRLIFLTPHREFSIMASVRCLTIGRGLVSPRPRCRRGVFGSLNLGSARWIS
jgi:hypothetical protein